MTQNLKITKCLHLIKMFRTINRYILLWSFALGVLLGVLLYKRDNIKQKEFKDNYNKWFASTNLQRTYLPMDFVQYGHYNKNKLESQFLFNLLKLKCVLLVRKKKNAIAANNTWMQHCNDRSFVYFQTEKVLKPKLPIQHKRLPSSWLVLCNAIRDMSDDFHWVIFVNDDPFALPENARRMIVDLDHNKGYYLGHVVSLWGVVYNSAQAGYILSRGSVNLLRSRFTSTDECELGGRFWKQEDYYLGRHLANLGVHPSDTRDFKGLTTFHGFSLGHLLAPNAFSSLFLSNYYTKSVFPARDCCSPFTITFQTIESDKMYTNYYLLYGLQVFREGGHLGNKPRLYNHKKDEKVWQTFIREQHRKDYNMSADAYYELWKSVVNDPVNFNQNIRKWSAPVVDDDLAVDNNL